jgi:hypothetical protein
MDQLAADLAKFMPPKAFIACSCMNIVDDASNWCKVLWLSFHEAHGSNLNPRTYVRTNFVQSIRLYAPWL